MNTKDDDDDDDHYYHTSTEQSSQSCLISNASLKPEAVDLIALLSTRLLYFMRHILGYMHIHA